MAVEFEILQITSFNGSSNKDLSLNIGWCLTAGVLFILRLFIKVEWHSIVREVLVMHRRFNIECVPADRLAVWVLHVLLFRRARHQVVLVFELGWLNAFTSIADAGACLILKLGLSFACVHETNTFHCDFGSAVRRDEPGLRVDDVGIVEAELDVIVGVVEAVESDLDGQDIGLGVHGDLALDSSISHQLCWLVDGIIGRVAESHFHVFAGRVLADEVSASDSHCLAILALQWAERGLDLSDMWRVIVSEAIRAVWRLDVDPVLIVERDLNQSMSAGRLWHRNNVDLLVGVAVGIDLSRLRDDLLRGRIQVPDVQFISSLARFRVDRRAIKRFEAETIDLNGSTATRRP